MGTRKVSTLFVAATLLVAVQPSPAATLTVTNLADNGPGSLRAALGAAASGDTIDFAVNGTIVLSSGELAVDRGLNILGPGPTLLTISGGGNSRVFRVESADPVTISGLAVIDGFASGDGGGLYAVDTDLELSDCSFGGNHAEGDGGGIFGTRTYPWSPLGFRIKTSSVTANSAAGSGGGVSVFSRDLEVADSVIAGNSAGYLGGGVSARTGASETSLTIARSTISGNRAVSGGGGLWCGSVSCNIADSAISANESGATLESSLGLLCGGGIAAAGGFLTVERTTVNGNIALTGGAGICSGFTDATIVDSKILSNTVRATPVSTDEVAAGGGGILSIGTLTLEGSTVSANTAGVGAGIRTNGETTISATAISDNLALSVHAFPGQPARGGGLGGCATLLNSTVSGNSADEGGGLHDLSSSPGSGENCTALDHTTVSNNSATAGSGIAGPATVRSSIIANNVGGANCSATLDSRGNNLEDGSSCGLLDLTDLSATDPLLGPLADNGGPTLTHLPAAGSPAINAAPLDGCPATDQRGLARPSGYLCDIGAIELGVESGDDSDGDGVADLVDPCTNPAGNQDMKRVRLKLSNINADTAASNDRLRLMGSFSLPAGSDFSAINPPVLGMRVIIENAAGLPRIAIVVPARARIGRGAGWASRRGDSSWRFGDKSGSAANGIRRIKIKDLGGTSVGVRIRGRNGLYPVVAGDEPLRVTVVLGDQQASALGRCGEASFGASACRFNPTATTLRCR
ncbi:MAG: choice-of-anchor Q domain-containing protein [Candidatus Binatia bacterium]